jgi:hypothetical protein
MYFNVYRQLMLPFHYVKPYITSNNICKYTYAQVTDSMSNQHSG